MLLREMIIRLRFRLKFEQAYPAQMRLAGQTDDMSTTTIFLNRTSTFRTILCPMFILPNFEFSVQFQGLFVLHASQAFMLGAAAEGADIGETIWAGEEVWGGGGC